MAATRKKKPVLTYIQRDLTPCNGCGNPMVACCPCNRAECTLKTPVPFCPTCENERLGKWMKAHGIRVCAEYVKGQLR
jgi:hypothetical protein